MNTDTDTRFRQLVDTIKPSVGTRVLRWLWYRNIDPEALIGWLAILLLLACLNGAVVFTIWRILR